MADEGTPTEKLLTFARFEPLPLLEPEIDVEVMPASDAGHVTLTAGQPAWFTWAPLANPAARCADNFLHLRTNEPVSIHVTAFDPVDPDRGKAALRVRRLHKTYPQT